MVFKELLRKDLLQIIVNILGNNINYSLMILNIIKQLAQKSYFLVKNTKFKFLIKLFLKEIFDSSKQTIIFILKMLGENTVVKNYAIKILKVIVLNGSDMFVGLNF